MKCLSKIQHIKFIGHENVTVEWGENRYTHTHTHTYTPGKLKATLAECKELCTSLALKLPLKTGKLIVSSSPTILSLCNSVGHYGVFPRQTPYPHILCFNSSLKCLNNSIWCTFPELFYRCQYAHLMEEINNLKTKSTVFPVLLEPENW